MACRWIVAILAAVATIGAAAQGGLRLTVQGDQAFPPYSYLQDGRPAGIDVEIMQELSRRSGVAFDIQLVPFRRLIESLRQGTVDLGMAVLRSSERESFSIYSGVLHMSSYALFVLKGREFPFTTLASLHGKRIGRVRGFFISEDFDAELAAGRIPVTESAIAEQSIRMLVAGRVDAISGQSVVTRYLAREMGLADRLSALPQALAPDRPAHLVLSRASAVADKERLAERLRLVLEGMHRDGTIGQIEAGHLR
jgi:polar amino acid transport system substrate-binding protein